MAAPISFSQKLALVFIPGDMEEIENSSRSHGNMAWYAVSSTIVASRNTFLVSTATTIIASGLALNSDSGSLKRYAFGTVAALGTVVAGLSGKTLFDSSKLLFQYVEPNRPERQENPALL